LRGSPSELVAYGFHDDQWPLQKLGPPAHERGPGRFGERVSDLRFCSQPCVVTSIASKVRPTTESTGFAMNVAPANATVVRRCERRWGYVPGGTEAIRLLAQLSYASYTTTFTRRRLVRPPELRDPVQRHRGTGRKTVRAPPEANATIWKPGNSTSYVNLSNGGSGRGCKKDARVDARRPRFLLRPRSRARDHGAPPLSQFSLDLCSTRQEAIEQPRQCLIDPDNRMLGQEN
jgi:hypothetical protein